MANITQYIQQLMSAIYGEDVRGSLRDALLALSDDLLTHETRIKVLENSSMGRPMAVNTSYDNTTSGLTSVNVQGAIDENASAVATLNSSLSTLNSSLSTWKTWQPHLYDLDSLIRSLGDARFLKVGKLGFLYGNYNNPNLSGITTMMQIRNLPFDCLTLGGSAYFSTKSGQGGTITIQIADNAIYFRPNILSSDFANPATNSGIMSFFAVACIR